MRPPILQGCPSRRLSWVRTAQPLVPFCRRVLEPFRDLRARDAQVKTSKENNAQRGARLGFRIVLQDILHDLIRNGVFATRTPDPPHRDHEYLLCRATAETVPGQILRVGRLDIRPILDDSNVVQG